MGEISGRKSLRVQMALVTSLCCVWMAASAVAQSGKLTLTRPKTLATPFTTLSSPGPLSNIFLGNELSSQISHTTDGSTYEVFPSTTVPADYGTFLSVAGTLYAPDFVNHGGTATGSLGSYVPLTPVSQSGPTGSGTAADPYRVVTVVDVGATGLRVTQTDSYVTGQESYRTDTVISNTSGATVNAILYRAMDCYLGTSDFGFGVVIGTAVGCAKSPNNSPPDRIEMLLPITGGNQYYEAFYSSVWAAISAQAPFDNTCACTSNIDNGIGLSWNISVPAGGSVTRSHLTIFSPEGSQALTTTKTADSATSMPGGGNGYTITVTNPNTAAVTLNSITDLLPAGFSYVAGSTTGVTTANPAVAGQQLTWSGPFNVPAAGSVSLHFSVTVTTVPGVYTNEATADAGAATVVGTGPTAPITVSGSPPSTEIPTVSTWGLLLLITLLAGAAVWRLGGRIERTR
jgi:uncharacterized repeat protein (TIGR01451 family)